METDFFLFPPDRRGYIRKICFPQGPTLPNVKDRSQVKVTVKTVEEVITFAQSQVLDFSPQLTACISFHLPANSTVVQIQMYGMGDIDSEFTNGSYQMAVALDLLSYFRRAYSACTATFQEPRIAPGESAYLKNHGIKVLDEVSFDGRHFREAEASFTADTSQQAVLVCYMIHVPWRMLDAFLAAHWTASQLSRIVIVGNSPQFYVNVTAKSKEISPRILAFAKVCKENSIEHFAGGRVHTQFSSTVVISISFEDATILTENMCFD